MKIRVLGKVRIIETASVKKSVLEQHMKVSIL